MMVHLIKCFREIYSTKISCSVTLYITIHNVSDCTNSIVTAESLFESKLVIRSYEERTKFIDNTIFENFGNDRANGYTSNTNLASILRRFRDIAFVGSKIAIFGYPSCV